MFSKRKNAATISDRTPVFHVRYIGCTETLVASGRGCSYAPVQRLWDNAPPERLMKKVAVHINTKGITMRPAEQTELKPRQDSNALFSKRRPSRESDQLARPGDGLSRVFGVEDISFCNTDRAVNERIFSWICRSPADGHLECHAVLCSTEQKAQTMAIVLSRAFQIAYKDWRTNHRHFLSAALAQGTSAASASSSSHRRSQSSTACCNDDGSQAISSESGRSSRPRSDGSGRKGRETSRPRSHSKDAASTSSLRRGRNDVAMTSFTPRQTTPLVEPPAGDLSCLSHGFASSSSILDPDLADEIGDVEVLDANLDLEEDRDLSDLAQ